MSFHVIERKNPIVQFIVSILARLYEWGLRLLQASYRFVPGRIRRIPAKVISIGNITWGGTGKTPLVAKLAAELRERGCRVAVLTRGYGQDEVEELKARLPGVPIFVGRDRIRAARQAVKNHQAEFLILDDGFQHIRLHRDLDIVNINATRPFGPGGLLPLGTLREPLSSLSRAHVFVLSKSNLAGKNLQVIRQKILSIKPRAEIFEAVHRPVTLRDVLRGMPVPFEALKGKSVATICGIEDPLSFEKTVENLGARVDLAARFRDHHPYKKRELSDFLRQCEAADIREAVTTLKDYYRLRPLLSEGTKGVALYVLEIELELNDEEAFIRRCLNS